MRWTHWSTRLSRLSPTITWPSYNSSRRSYCTTLATVTPCYLRSLVPELQSDTIATLSQSKLLQASAKSSPSQPLWSSSVIRVQLPNYLYKNSVVLPPPFYSPTVFIVHFFLCFQPFAAVNSIRRELLWSLLSSLVFTTNPPIPITSHLPPSHYQWIHYSLPINLSPLSGKK